MIKFFRRLFCRCKSLMLDNLMGHSKCIHCGKVHKLSYNEMKYIANKIAEIAALEGDDEIELEK